MGKIKRNPFDFEEIKMDVVLDKNGNPIKKGDKFTFRMPSGTVITDCVKWACGDYVEGIAGAYHRHFIKVVNEI